MTEKIDYPEKHSEAEIQSLLWYSLRRKGIDARLQVSTFNPRSGKRSLKMDLVVFAGKVARCIVECKSWSDGYSRNAIYRTNNTGQLKKYRAIYGLPVLVCARMGYITETIRKIEKILV